jgi:hypothetical protein
MAGEPQLGNKPGRALACILILSRVTETGSNAMTDREFMILGKLFLTFGCLLGLPLWELWKLRQSAPPETQEAEHQETR